VTLSLAGLDAQGLSGQRQDRPQISSSPSHVGSIPLRVQAQLRPAHLPMPAVRGVERAGRRAWTQEVLAEVMSLVTESLASPNSIIVLGWKNSSFSTPAKPGRRLRFNTRMCSA
jgi:hypothetical protein